MSTSNRRYLRLSPPRSTRPRSHAHAHAPAPAPLTLGRRDALRLMAASAALASTGGCRQPREEIVPHVKQPERPLPNEPVQHATAMSLYGGAALGLLVTSRMGRPIKIEGNPDHPASLGATDLFAQAAVLELYDPDRSQTVVRDGAIGSWPAALAALRSELSVQRSSGGAGLRVLTGVTGSPTLNDQLQALRAGFPNSRVYAFDPVAHERSRNAARALFGRTLDCIPNASAARVVVALDDDLMCSRGVGLRFARQLMEQRRSEGVGPAPARLYVVESTPSGTGALADHRLPLPPSQITELAYALARELGLPEGTRPVEPKLPPLAQRWLQPLARDLQRNRGASLITVGEGAPLAVHALVHRLNLALGNVGRTVQYVEPAQPAPVLDSHAELRALAEEMANGKVELLLILGANPLYTAPADLDFARALARVRRSVHLGLYQDETAERCWLHVPEAHFLEAWSDATAYDGSATIVQPSIAPLYDGTSAHELIAALLEPSPPSGYEIVRRAWRARFTPRAPVGGDARESGAGADDAFERFWRRALHDGIVAGSAHEPVIVAPPPSAPLPVLEPPNVADAQPQNDVLELVLRPHPTVWDGRFANNAWLQECPQPLTKLTWDNAVLLAPATADRLGLVNGDVVSLQRAGRSVQGAVWIAPGHAEQCATVHLGYGRRRTGRVGRDTGFDGYALRTSDEPWGGGGLQLQLTGQQHVFACTSHHHEMHGRDLVRRMTHAALARAPWTEGGPDRPNPSLLPPLAQDGPRWGMTIDLTACSGCNACVVACQAENNVPVVGKREVVRQREMHWLRIDTYYRGDPRNPEIDQQPVPCMHCETAPCELVCPVGATLHDDQGLNQMVYNRCIGTRYCSNNCPYKVRRFNFFRYADPPAPVARAVYNPEVTVRSRGVMEKCTYCVQRIEHARITSQREGRELKANEVETACQAACPTRAITFGDLARPDSAVAERKRSRRNYALLHELDTRPRTTYLMRVGNPNPELPTAGPVHDDE